MKKSTKRVIQIGGLGIFILFLGITWFYPYSFFSLKKSVTYEPYGVAVKDYKKMVNEVKQTVEPNDPIQPILNLYEQNWLMSEKNVSMTVEDIDEMLKKVKEARSSLIQLDLGTISPYEVEDRNILLGNCDSFKKHMENIKKHKTHTRMKINREYHNLMAGFMTSVHVFVEFYEIYEKDEEHTE
ncbi:hypothetical protein [Bacillus sp. AFS041924]|uniref:hypothetical protein n=1 Tax=Bacillus sp. AFS041924 TaxID=2033503 RepID=UPI000BFE2339|nr:hypothetical protein [Bacillus sp. AFS041924]PGS56556.1 hypothetical protein COC46_00390 [Bacillus sp. AFS041924]